MDTNIDLRFSKTDKMIKDAFLQLIDNMDFEKISVTNITKMAKVSRATFYLHYEDKYDLLEKIEDEILEGLSKISCNVNIDDIVKAGFSGDTAQLLLLEIYKYIKTNQIFFKTILCNNADPYFYYKLNKQLTSIYEEKENGNRLKIPKNYAVAFVIAVQISFINEWIKSGMNESPEEMVSMIGKLLNEIPKNLVE